ncbi:hypothetical protein F5884DRAFT_885995 [Xylogone sp. PMI_703]|nr:hypothetical protein F5884DRAFT_885995 [Xylogone sp. PMI_703]
MIRPGAIVQQSWRRVFGHPNGLELVLRDLSAGKVEGTLPRVRFIHALFIRRQFYRAFSITQGLRLILEALPSLNEIIYEPWRGINVESQELRDKEHHVLFDHVFKNYGKRLRKVTIFEDSDSEIHGNLECSPTLGQDLAVASQQFEELHATLLIDAKDFFHMFWPGQKPQKENGLEWKRLKYLALTSYSLNPRDYDELIRAAAAAAQKMPHLKVMELWNCRRGEAYVFRYESRAVDAQISMISTWEPRLSWQAKADWRTAAKIHNNACEIHVSPVVNLDANRIKRQTSVLPYLAQGRHLLSWSSWRQKLFEEE